ncbi:MAG: hypothetical protein IKQ46_03290 [Bacteroidales bacterium]|nr:hypothetical protein [Bacteroidales bacterium]
MIYRFIILLIFILTASCSDIRDGGYSEEVSDNVVVMSDNQEEVNLIFYNLGLPAQNSLQNQRTVSSGSSVLRVLSKVKFLNRNACGVATLKHKLQINRYFRYLSLIYQNYYYIHYYCKMRN